MSTSASQVLLNGQPADTQPDALRALAQVNYGHFTSLQVRGGRAQALGLHLARLREGNAELFGADLDEASIRGWMAQAADVAGGDCALRVTVFSRHFDHRQPLREIPLDVLVSAGPPATHPLQPLRVRCCRFLRPLPHIKHVGTFPLLHQRRQARLAGFDDALFVDGDGGRARIVEGSVWNIGFWDGTGIVWPQAPALRGTTERMLQAGLAAQGVPQVVRPVEVGELAGFQAAFAANANGLQAIAAIDAMAFASHPGLVALLGAAAAHAPWEALAGAG